MKRREFFTLLGGAAAAWPIAANAQPAKTMIGFVHTATDEPSSQRQVAALRQGLKGAGFVDGQNVTLELHWAEGHYDRLPQIMGDLVRRQVAVILACGGTAPGEAAKAATNTLPIVFVTGDDPLRVGLVASLNRPGGNVTGVIFFNSALASKRLEILREMLPSAKVIAYIANPDSPNAEQEIKDMTAAAQALGVALHVVMAVSGPDINSSYDKIAAFGAQALMIAADPFLGSQRERSIALGIRLAIPVVGTTRDYVMAGGIMS